MNNSRDKKQVLKFKLYLKGVSCVILYSCPLSSENVCVSLVIGISQKKNSILVLKFTPVFKILKIFN